MAQFYYGGQALIEGVMMRGRSRAMAAVRGPDGNLHFRGESLPDYLYRRGPARWPLLRGVVALRETMVLGTRMMLFSADVQVRRGGAEEIPRGLVAGMMAISVTIAVALFFVFPLLLARSGAGHHSSLVSNLVEGAIRLLLFLGYLALIGRMARMERIFQYHGAEHKTINAYEHGAPLIPTEVQRFSTIHVRCGTAFLLWIVVVSIALFALVGSGNIAVSIAERIILVPLIAAVSYELLRLGARFQRVAAVRAIMTPGLLLQRLTTREPSDDQVAVAIAALEAVLAADGVRAEARNRGMLDEMEPAPASS